ncbi:hypothetical protein DITRI_Ditri11bG0087800 [Diplodiscus trichospermus]
MATCKRQPVVQHSSVNFSLVGVFLSIGEVCVENLSLLVFLTPFFSSTIPFSSFCTSLALIFLHLWLGCSCRPESVVFTVMTCFKFFLLHVTSFVSLSFFLSREAVEWRSGDHEQSQVLNLYDEDIFRVAMAIGFSVVAFKSFTNCRALNR